MCGIIGGWWAKTTPNDLEIRAKEALRLLKHRGPNDEGWERYADPYGSVALGQTRLSIIDLSSAGHQPMHSPCGRYTLVFNGEIYNYRELRQCLQTLGHRFLSDSDTEVLLIAWKHWGKECLLKLDGMFAFVIYDNSLHTLTCVRDAFGIKPFFFDRGPSSFIFSSEQSALLALRGGRWRANWQRSYDYLVHGDYDSQENTFIEGIKHLMPGHLIEVDLTNWRTYSPQCWWRPSFQQTSQLSFPDAAQAVREQFLKNIRLHLRSDVPLGIALSGGIDSSAILCAIRYLEPDLPLSTFSYIASGSLYSEDAWVDKVNTFVGAKAHKVSASSSELFQDIDSMIQSQGEPFGSTSIYAQYRVFQLAREHGITVTLDGQGADELLAGYDGYPGYRLLSLLEQHEPLAAHNFAKAWSRWPGRTYRSAWMKVADIVLPNSIHTLARKQYGRNFTPSWLKMNLLEDAGISISAPRFKLNSVGKGIRVKEILANSLQLKGLPHLLRHGDRNSMAFSIESRVPFLTTEMAKLLLSLPENYLISNDGETKSIFRAAMKGIVPHEILNRRDKIGFVTPEKAWLSEMSTLARTWLSAGGDIPFMNIQQLLAQFDAITEGKVKFNWQVWRWINLVRWHQLFSVVF